MKSLTGLIPPLATPMRDGRVDFTSMRSMVDDLLDDVAGVLVGGSVGEIVSLTLDERIEILRAVAGQLEDRHALCFTVADNSIANTRRLADAASEIGVDLLVISAPNYFSIGMEMLEQYLVAVSEFSAVNLCLYDNPVATHMTLGIADLERLARNVPRLTHVKVTDKSMGKVAALRRGDTHLEVLGGEDAVLWHQLSEGASGAMVALPMICPRRASRIWDAFAAGDLDRAYEEYAPAAVFIHAALGGADYVAIIKAALHERGVIASPEVRLPLTPLTRRRYEDVVRSLRYLEQADARSEMPA